MTSAEGHRIRTLIVAIAAGLLFLALAIAEVLAEPAWATHVRAVDAALARGDITAAAHASRDAYAAALGSRGWEGMVAVGDAYLRVGELHGARSVYRARARRAYLEGLVRARNQRSVDGVLRAAQAFAGLGDRQVVAQSIRIAEAIAGDDHASRARVRAFAAEVSEPVLTAGSHRVEPF